MQTSVNINVSGYLVTILSVVLCYSMIYVKSLFAVASSLGCHSGFIRPGDCGVTMGFKFRSKKFSRKNIAGI